MASGTRCTMSKNLPDVKGGLLREELIEQIDTRIAALRPLVTELAQLEAAPCSPQTRLWMTRSTQWHGRSSA